MAVPNINCRVVVTGTGVVTSIGQTVNEFWSNLKHGTSGIAPIEGIELENLNVRIAAQVRGFDQRARLKHWRRDKTIHHSDRFSWLAAAAADEAIAQAGIQLPLINPMRSACIIGSAGGGQITGEKACRDRFLDNKLAVHPMFLPRMISSSAAAHVGIEYGIEGPTFAICSAGASAAHAISIGRDYIRHGLCDIAIVGGSDSSLTYGVLLACQPLHLISPHGCFPFARNRTGTVLAEGAGILILESQQHAEARGAAILAEVCGIGMTSNSHDMLAPDVEAAGESMRMALEEAGIEPSSVGYLNANGTATRANDRDETQAIKNVFKSHARNLSISSTKSMHGHAMGASAAIEAAACIKALNEGWMPATIGLDEADPECDLDYIPNVGRNRDLEYVMSNAFSLGGFNTALVLGRPDL